MQHRWSGFARLTAVAGLVLAAACQDIPTGPAPVLAAGAPVGLNQGQHNGQVPVVCSLGAARVSALGFDWLRKQDTIYVPRAEMDPAGRTVEYRFSANNRDGIMVFGANCPSVPYTENALRRLDRRFLVRENGGADEFKRRQGAVTVAGCVQTEKGCLLETITVTAQPNEEQEVNPCDYDPQGCWGDFGGGDDGGGWTPEGPSGPECLPGDTNCDGDTADDGPGAFLLCVAAVLGADGMTAIVSTGYSLYELYDARQRTRTAYRRWAEYVRDYNGTPNYDPAMAGLLKSLYEEAQGEETKFVALLTVSGMYSAGKLGYAVAVCAPLAPAPTL